MKWIKSPIPWSTLLGMVVGNFGIPIYLRGEVPNTVTGWVWNRPDGFHTASIAIVGTLGFLVGVAFHFGFGKHFTKRTSVWITSMLSFVLVWGTIGVFGYQAYQESAMWTKMNQGFSDVWAVTTSMSRSHRITTMEGYDMIRAGGDIQATTGHG